MVVSLGFDSNLKCASRLRGGIKAVVAPYGVCDATAHKRIFSTDQVQIDKILRRRRRRSSLGKPEEQ